MSEKEFELYLSLLGRFLRLKPGQRNEIADEMQDHLEARLEELSKSGLSRDEAIHAALEEFGDAADLAHHFTHIAQRRKRRFLMRCTLGTVLGLAAAMLITNAFWPGQQVGPVPKNAVAQPGADAKPQSPLSVQSNFVTPPRDDRYQTIVENLKTRHDVNFQETSIREACDYLAQLVKLPIIYDQKSLADQDLDIDAVTVTLAATDVPAATALDLIFWQHGLSYRIWDGFIIVSSQSTAREIMEVYVYNCRDLLENVSPIKEAVRVKSHGGGAGGGGFYQVTDNPSSTPPTNPTAASDSEKGSQPTDAASLAELSPSQALIRVLMNSVEGPWAEVEGEGGTITAFDGLLVVRNNQKAQQDVQSVLEMLRSADKIHQRPKSKKPEASKAESESIHKAKETSADALDPLDFSAAPKTPEPSTKVPDNRK